MGRRKKRRSGAGEKPAAPSTEMEHRPFAGLASRRAALQKESAQAKERAAQEKAARARSAREAAEQGRPMVAAQEWVQRGAVEMSDEDL